MNEVERMNGAECPANRASDRDGRPTELLVLPISVS